MYDSLQSSAGFKVVGPGAPPGFWRRLLRAGIHSFSHKFLLTRSHTATTRAAGFRLRVRPTVFHPRFFVTSEFFASFIGELDLRGKRVLDIGTGSGILALAAARSGAAAVTALDINPNAALTAAENAHLNGLGDRVAAVCSNLLSALSPRAGFDVIVTNPPYFSDEPRDLADRAWHAGPGLRDIAALFEQARQRLAANGTCYVLLSSDCDLDLFGRMIGKAGFTARLVAERSLVIESLLIFALQPV